jgi:hypothetical protein
MDALALRTLASTLCGHLGLDELFVPDKHISEMYGVLFSITCMACNI